MPDHTVKAFDADLANLTRRVAELHERVEKELRDSVEALIRNDDELVKAVLALGETSTALGRDIEANVMLLVARRQPVANDLRFIIAIWEAAIELNRISGIARSVAKRASVVGSDRAIPQSVVWGLRRITRAALNQLRAIVNSLIHADAITAEALSVGDHAIDAIYVSLCRELLTYITAYEPSPLLIHLLFCVKSIESVGDNVTNIATAVLYLVHGHRTGWDRENSLSASTPQYQ
jgi:phosphate transport system protein